MAHISIDYDEFDIESYRGVEFSLASGKKGCLYSGTPTLDFAAAMVVIKAFKGLCEGVIWTPTVGCYMQDDLTFCLPEGHRFDSHEKDVIKTLVSMQVDKFLHEDE